VDGRDDTILDSESNPNGGELMLELYTNAQWVMKNIFVTFREAVVRMRARVGAVKYQPPHRRTWQCSAAMLLFWMLAPLTAAAEVGVGHSLVQTRVDRINQAYHMSDMTNDDIFKFTVACESTVSRTHVFGVAGNYPNQYCVAVSQRAVDSPAFDKLSDAVARVWNTSFEFVDSIFEGVYIRASVSLKGLKDTAVSAFVIIKDTVTDACESLLRICMWCTAYNFMITCVVISLLMLVMLIVWKVVVLTYVAGKYRCDLVLKEAKKQFGYNPLTVIDKRFGNWQSSATGSVMPINTEKATTLVDLIHVNTVSGKHVYKTKEHGSLRFVLPCVESERSIDSSKVLTASKQHAHCCAIVTREDEFIENATVVSCNGHYYMVTAHHGVIDDDVYVRGIGAKLKYKLFVNGQPNSTLFQSRHVHSQGDVDVFKISNSFSSLVGVKTNGCPEVRASGGAYTNQGLILRFVRPTENGYQSHVSSGNVGGIATKDTSNQFSVQHTCSTDHGDCGAVAVEDGTNTAVLVHTSGYTNQPRNAGTDITCVFVDLNLLERIAAPALVYQGDDCKVDNEDSGRIRGRRLHEDFLDSGRRFRGEVRNGSRFAEMESVVLSKKDYAALTDALLTLSKKLEVTQIPAKKVSFETSKSGNVSELKATATPDDKSPGQSASVQPCPQSGTASGQSSATPPAAEGGKKNRKRDKTPPTEDLKTSESSADSKA
jgi:hypothetical protein